MGDSKVFRIDGEGVSEFGGQSGVVEVCLRTLVEPQRRAEARHGDNGEGNT